jgi:hypothetical protein
MSTRSGAVFRMSQQPDVPDSQPGSPQSQAEGLGAILNPGHDVDPVPGMAEQALDLPAVVEHANLDGVPVVAVPAADNAGRSRQLLPKDPLKLMKFRGDNDLSNVDDFLFCIEMYINAYPALACALNEASVRPEPLRSALATIMGCFPAGSVALTWFRNNYRAGCFTSFETFSALFTAQFQHATSDLVTLQTRWEHASQRRGQNVHEYYRYLLTLQSQIAGMNFGVKPTETAFLNKFCASLRSDLQRYLQEKRVDHPDYTLSQLITSASVRERAVRNSNPAPSINFMDGTQKPGRNDQNDKKWCYFCKSNTHSADECRRIAARKARGEWQERPRPRK